MLFSQLCFTNYLIIMEIKKFIDEYKNLSSTELLDVLKQRTDLTPTQKNIIYVYLHPTNLGDMELVSKFKKYRISKDGNITGKLEPVDNEIIMLLNAYRCRQYNKYIRHLLHSFVKKDNSIVPIDGNEVESCGICGKPVYQYGKWQEKCCELGRDEVVRKEHLSLGGDGTDIVVCLDCLIQLGKLHDLLQEIEGSDYLDNWKK